MNPNEFHQGSFYEGGFLPFTTEPYFHRTSYKVNDDTQKFSIGWRLKNSMHGYGKKVTSKRNEEGIFEKVMELKGLFVNDKFIPENEHALITAYELSSKIAKKFDE